MYNRDLFIFSKEVASPFLENPRDMFSPTFMFPLVKGAIKRKEERPDSSERSVEHNNLKKCEQLKSSPCDFFPFL